LNVVGNATFNDFVTFNDSAMVEKHLRVNAPYMDPLTVSLSVRSQPEFEVRNPSGAKIFQVDGHEAMTTIQNLTVQSTMLIQGNLSTLGDVAADDIHASQYMSMGGTTFGASSLSATDWNKVTRKDYVDYNREAQIGVPTAFSYDASLISPATGFTPQYNDAVYYLNGNVVFYHDSTSVAAGPAVPLTSPNAGDNYTITVKGNNFTGLLSAVGGSDEVSAQLWLENNVLDLGAAHSYDVVDDETITFNLGYSDLDALTDCTSGVIRPTLALGRATDGFHMTGLHFFFDIVE